MGYGGWDKDKSGASVNSRSESRPDGGTTEHHLWDRGGDKKDHQHVVVERDSTGRVERTHAYPNKSKR